MANSVMDAVGEGLAPLPFNRPKKITIEYSQGQTIILKGNSLRVFWQEYAGMIQLRDQLSEGGPIIPSEEIREAFETDDEEE